MEHSSPVWELVLGECRFVAVEFGGELEVQLADEGVVMGLCFVEHSERSLVAL